MKDWSSMDVPKFARFECRHCGRKFEVNPLLFYPIHAYPCPYCKKGNDIIVVLGDKVQSS